MKSYKLVLSLAFLFFCAQLFIPDVFAQAQQGPRREVIHKSQRGQKNLLNLTDEQRTKLQELSEKWRAERKEVAEMAKAKRAELKELMKDREANEAKIEKLQDEMFLQRFDQFKRSREHRKEARKVFTPDQLEKLDAQRKRFAQRGEALRRGLHGVRGRFFGRFAPMRRGRHPFGLMFRFRGWR